MSITEQIKKLYPLFRLSFPEGLEYRGPDADLEGSLGFYGIIWTKEPDKDGDYRFIFRTHQEPDIMEMWVNWAAINKDIDIEKEYPFVDIREMCDYFGDDLSEWLLLPAPRKIHDLVNYYGWQNIFGESYAPQKIRIPEDYNT